MIVGNISGRTPYQYNVSIAIEKWGLAYQKVSKDKMINKYGFNGMSGDDDKWDHVISYVATTLQF